MQKNRLMIGDVREGLRRLPDGCVHCCVTSPPYWGLRDYGVAGQIGLEPEVDCLGWATGAPCGECYVCHLAEVFREVRRVLHPSGVAWVNLGDSYATGAGKVGDHSGGGNQGKRWLDRGPVTSPNRMPQRGLKPKDMAGVPWRVAFALQADGWYLRQEVIWHKPNAMPQSIKDRCTPSHEQVFLLSKSRRYYFDSVAIQEAAVSGESRNRRTVWTIPTKPYKDAHFATFPPDLVRPCILAGTSEEGVCGACGAPWRRVVELITENRSNQAKAGNSAAGGKWSGGTSAAATTTCGMAQPPLRPRRLDGSQRAAAARGWLARSSWTRSWARARSPRSRGNAAAIGSVAS